MKKLMSMFAGLTALVPGLALADIPMPDPYPGCSTVGFGMERLAGIALICAAMAVVVCLKRRK